MSEELNPNANANQKKAFFLAVIVILITWVAFSTNSNITLANNVREAQKVAYITIWRVQAMNEVTDKILQRKLFTVAKLKQAGIIENTLKMNEENTINVKDGDFPHSIDYVFDKRGNLVSMAPVPALQAWDYDENGEKKLKDLRRLVFENKDVRLGDYLIKKTR